MSAAREMKRAKALLEESLVWDNHGCMPLRPEDVTFLPQLGRYTRAGVNVCGLNVVFDGVPWQHGILMLATLRRWIRAHGSRYRLVETVGDIRRARRDRKLGVFFDVEGGCALNGQLSLVELYRDLGVRWMLLAYNRSNLLGGGCQDTDRGLTSFGRRVVAEMNRVGITVCCSHTGFRTTMDVMTNAEKPVIFSHSNPLGVWKHKRNVRDVAIQACAATGGVIGINGFGLFLGRNDASPENFVRHVDYVAQLVGPRHVGLGLDYVFDAAEFDAFVASDPQLFPASEGYGDGVHMVAPADLHRITSELLRLGYGVADVRGVLGGNFMRVAEATWPRREQLSGAGSLS